MTTVLDRTADPRLLRGRGAVSNAAGRYERHARVLIDDGWDDGWREGDDAPPPLRTEVIADATRTIITRNQSPDISFDRSINPYRGCEHGCIYCFARPTHAYLGMSPGRGFRIQPVRQAQRGGAAGQGIVGARLRAAAPSRSAPTPIPISRSSRGTGSCAACWRC